jgi:hypothetical protein
VNPLHDFGKFFGKISSQTQPHRVQLGKSVNEQTPVREFQMSERGLYNPRPGKFIRDNILAVELGDIFN